MALLVNSLEFPKFPSTIFPHRNPNNLKGLTTRKNNVKLRIRVCAAKTQGSSGVSVCEQFSLAVVKEEEEEEEEKQKYYVNMGYAIRTVREEFPELFYRELSFDIYRDDIVLKDPFNTFTGIDNYKSIFWALRFHGRMFFRALWIDIISVWQPMENVIMVRWTIHGIPRVPWESRARFDGTSEYKLDKNGKIYEHRVDNVALNSPPKFRIMGVEEMIRSTGYSSTPRPTCFGNLPSSFAKYVPLLVEFASGRKTKQKVPNDSSFSRES